ncbi:hypothetical protein E2562_019679 [Oryza meyeriana var. granulata]|uniref:Uncharacterized protein n=1 Tax=Oryza meyeriana var. granulata TaxID=110450 RepID=A0A6G1C7Q8_9ORYZ|nr:hypothetical protein E2562_019679 [Oryza meyeriana var. granulata]
MASPDSLGFGSDGSGGAGFPILASLAPINFTRVDHGGGDSRRITVPLAAKGAAGSEGIGWPSGALGEDRRRHVEDSLGRGRWRRPTAKLRQGQLGG